MVPENVYTEMIGFVLLVLTPAVMSCAVFDFEENYGVVYDGDVTQVQVGRPVAASDCRRACILTPGCRGFNMRWIGTPGEVGYCSLTAMTTHASLLWKRGNSFYVWCPRGMKFSLEFGRCYVVVKERKSWQDSEDYCKTQHRQAHLVEIYDVIQNSAFRKMTNDKPSIGFWLGARRINETGDVIWISKSLPVLDMEYTNFESGEPASERTGADCLKWFRGRWSMTSCSEVKAFVCEY